MRFFLLAALAFATVELPGQNLPSSDLGRVKDGTQAPDFTLQDQHGKPVRLSGFRGNKTVVLVFYRGYW